MPRVSWRSMAHNPPGYTSGTAPVLKQANIEGEGNFYNFCPEAYMTRCKVSSAHPAQTKCHQGEIFGCIKS